MEFNAKLSLMQLMLGNVQSSFLNDQDLAISVHNALGSAGRDSDISSGNTSLTAGDIHAIGGLLTDERVYNYLKINIVGQAMVDTARDFMLAAMFFYEPTISVIDKQPLQGYYYDWNKIYPQNPLVNAKWSQINYGENFSYEGQKALSGLTGIPIESVDDLASAIENGLVDPKIIPIGYISRDGHTLIYNTRSSIAQTRAGVPRDIWFGNDLTGDPFFEGKLSERLIKNGLTSSGTDAIILRRK